MPRLDPLRALLATALLGCAVAAHALETDRQQPLEVNADSTDGTLGDGVTVLRGHVYIKQGTLRINADRADVEKVEGKVRQVVLYGDPAVMVQEIEQQGVVEARAKTITYHVGSGLVTLEGGADVKHPQYEISGEQLTYDLNAQHFMGSGTDDGRIRIRMDPEVEGTQGEKAPAATEGNASSPEQPAQAGGGDDSGAKEPESAGGGDDSGAKQPESAGGGDEERAGEGSGDGR